MYKNCLSLILVFVLLLAGGAHGGIVGQWKLDETSGSTTYDSSGNGNNGTLVNMADSNWVSGKVGGALNFDGDNDCVTIARSSVLETGNASTYQLSVSAWIKSNRTGAPTSYKTVVGTGNGGWFIGSAPNEDKLFFACWLLLHGHAGQTAIVSNPTPVFDGNWHHIIAVFDSSAVHLYVDGNHAEGSTIGGTIINLSNNSVVLGEDIGETGRHWDGLIDDVKIYDTALSKEDAYSMENPNYPWNPSPAGNATSVPVDAKLSWSRGIPATSHDVYFGTDAKAVASATNKSGEFKGNQSGTTFNPGKMAYNTTYYWRVDEVNTSEPGSPWKGRIWSFTTKVVTGRQTLTEPVTGRRHILYVPMDYDATHSYPLIISSHGTSQNGDTEMDSTGPNNGFDNGTPTWPTLAEENDVIVACPDMTGAYGPCKPDATRLSRLASDDTAIMKIISAIEGTYNINAGAILITGFSGGGHVVHYTGLRHPDVFHAYCARHGNFSINEVPGQLPDGATNMPVYIFTGKNDTVDGPSESIAWYKSQGFNYLTTETFIDSVSSKHTTDRQHAMKWFSSVIKPRVIVSTDIGGDDPDDFQALVHYLVHADKFDTEGLISSPPCQGRLSDILETLDAYEADYKNLNSHASFPTPQSLRAISKQGAIDASPPAGYTTATDGSNLIISCAHRSDPRPLWVLVWGSITDIAQAVHDDPGIKNKIRVYSISSWNTEMDPHSRDYLYNNHPDMWWIQADTTFRGVYIGGNQSGDLGNDTFVEQHIRPYGALGAFFYSKLLAIKMGDTPTDLYLLSGNPDDPTTPSWGGMFKPTSHGSHYWTDLTDPKYNDSGDFPGAKTVNMWREAWLRDWQTRMDWADAP